MAMRDTVAQIILMIQVNLIAGTVTRYAMDRPDLHPLFEDILNFNVMCVRLYLICLLSTNLPSGSYMPTEVEHGCDARKLETIATLQSDGSFDLHTPHPGASK